MNLICRISVVRCLNKIAFKNQFFPFLRAGIFSGLLFIGSIVARGDAMLELFQMNWNQVSEKMPEIAEAGYDSLWLPNPAKASSVYSVGYDQFDPFDLGDKNQEGTVATRYGTKADLLKMVQMAHRFGIRVYFDNVMNHRGFTVPGYDKNTPTNYYPGLLPQDFHLQTTTANGGLYANWPNVSDFTDVQQEQYDPLEGLIDLAQEPGNVNGNFGNAMYDTIPKFVWLRQPNNPDYYMDTNMPSLGGSWHPFNGTNGEPIKEDVGAYLIRAAMWTLYSTKCDGFRMDAVKHVPSGFFGADPSPSNPFTDDPTFSGYTGGIQAMYDWTHGYGNNVTGNGYVETDGNRNSCFDSEAPRNDALLFGEHLGAPPSFQEYLNRGMRLLNAPLRDQMNNAMNGSASFSGMDGRDYTPPKEYGTYACFSAAQGVQFAQSHDTSGSYSSNRQLQNAYYFMHEGIPVIYSDGYNEAGPVSDPNTFPEVPLANYLGEFGDNWMPDIAYVHNQLARGGTRSRWSDQNVIAFERYDYRDVDSPGHYGDAYTNADATVALLAMNDDFGSPGDISFDDGVSRTSDGYYGTMPVSNSRNLGLTVGFPPGSILAQLSSSAVGRDRAYPKLLVHGATSSLSEAQATANDPDPVNRLIYVGGQTITPGGGAIELTIPSGGWVIYGYQWPEPSRVNPSTNAIILRQGGIEVPHIIVDRQDGTDGDANYNPLFPFKMRGSVDAFGNVITGSNVAPRTYAIDIPVVTNAAFDILVRNDASSANTLVKLDGGIDINSQMGLGATAHYTGQLLDLRDNPPGYASDVFLGYEQTAFQFRYGPEKFAARDSSSNNIVSTGAETYSYVVGSTNDDTIPGSGYGADITNQTADWIIHDPGATNSAANPDSSTTQRVPLNPEAGQSVDIYVKVGYEFQVNTCYIYYTTDGSIPDGAFGIGKGTTQLVAAHFANHDSAQSDIDWWKGTIPAQANGTQVRYKIALFNNDIQPISDSESSKLYGLTQTAITNFNPTTALVWLDNDLKTNDTIIGLQSGFHILRARTFLPRTNKSAVFNTFSQTFYYDAALPTGVIAFPTDNDVISSGSYTVVVRGDSSVTGVDFNIQDSDSNNDDNATGQLNGNGLINGSSSFAAALQVTPDSSLNAKYPTYPEEFRFTYTNVPTSGTAKIFVRLKEFSTSVYPNRFTTLTNTITTEAPAQVVEISSPAADGSIITMSSNAVYLIQVCLSPGLPGISTNYFLYINHVLQPQSSYILRPPGAVAGCDGMRSLLYNWSNPQTGSNVIEIDYTNEIASLHDTRTVIVTPPLRISVSPENNQTVVWDGASGVNYQVLTTTNLARPFTVISGIIAGTGSSVSYYDTSPAAPQKFYEIEIVH